MPDYQVHTEIIAQLYNRFNIIFFNGVLPTVSRIKFIIDSSKEEAAGYTYVNDEKIYNTFIAENPELEELYKNEKPEIFDSQYKYVLAVNDKLCTSERLVMETLLHEMIHIYQFHLDFEKYSKPKTWEMQHNRVFLSKMRYVNEEAKRLHLDINIDVAFLEK